MNTAAAASIVCIASALALVAAERRNSDAGRWIFKILASTAFIAVAFANGAQATRYGRLILLALALSWLGDVLLLSKRESSFLAGIAAFLLAHVAFAFAFASLPVTLNEILFGLLIMSVVGAGLLYWLLPKLSGVFRIAVPAYVAAIVIMCGIAIAAGVAGNSKLIPLGALIFAASDVFVARDRFVEHAFANKAVGLPLYYVAQLCLALSVVNMPS